MKTKSIQTTKDPVIPIYERYLQMCDVHDVAPTQSVMDIAMTLHFAKRDIPELDANRLLESSDFDFVHDMFGLFKHLNRRTCRVENSFLPRCAR